MQTFEVQSITCASCGHPHGGATVAYICVGCPCPLTPGKLADDIATAVAVTNANGAPAWLAAVCDPKAWQDAIRTPFPLEYEGARYALATDGKVMVALRGDFDMKPSAMAESARAVFGTPETFTLVAFDRFLAWAKHGIPAPNPEPCKQCKGTTRITCPDCKGDGSVECTCNHCDDVHEADCETCDDKHTVACPCEPETPLLPGFCLGKPLNLWLFGRFAEHFPATAEVKIGTASREEIAPVYFWTDDWRLIVMPLAQRAGDPPYEGPEL